MTQITTDSYQTLIDATSLQALMASGRKLRIVDVSFDLSDTDVGEHAFAARHIPGAVYAHIDRDLSGPKTGANGRHPLPSRQAFALTLARLGITPDCQVVVYDAQGGIYASRLWWMLRWAGHAQVALLDGGLNAWGQIRGALSSLSDDALDAIPDPVESPAQGYPIRDSLVPAIDTGGLMANMDRLLMIDARAPERFRGEVEYLDPRAGHVPGSINRFFKDNLQADGQFKPAATLAQEYGALLASKTVAEVVHQCGSGITACHNLLAMEHAGLKGSVLYPGSWSEWCADPARPIELG
jgi:thiosulfate/3-mercaptopyruvate sulfurtransferase